MAYTQPVHRILKMRRTEFFGAPCFDDVERFFLFAENDVDGPYTVVHGREIYVKDAGYGMQDAGYKMQDT